MTLNFHSHFMGNDTRFCTSSFIGVVVWRGGVTFRELDGGRERMTY